jgi:hypothetical protein
MMLSRALLAVVCGLLSTMAVAADPEAPVSKQPYLYVLGVAQDAGYPQAGCYQPHCMPGWENHSLRRGATSIALIDPTAGAKYLFDATPNLPEQLYRLDVEAPSAQYALGWRILNPCPYWPLCRPDVFWPRGHGWRPDSCVRYAAHDRVPNR